MDKLPLVTVPELQTLIQHYLRTTEEAAEEMNLTPRHVANLAQEGALPGSFRLGSDGKGPWLIPAAVVRNYPRMRYAKRGRAASERE